MDEKEEKIVVNPYNVKGEVNYERLVKEFGLEKIDDKILKKIKKHAGEIHPMLRRGIFFAGRDLNWVLDEYEKGNKFFLYTGCGPSGPIHIGHLMVWYFTKWLQDKFDCELYFQFTDDEKFLYKDFSYEEIQKSVNYSSGYALRFPRCRKIRNDKGPKQADDLKKVEQLYKQQRGKK